LNLTSHQISIRDDVYSKLLHLKKENESFSDLIDRLSDQEKGSWNNLEQLKGIAGSDDLELEKRISMNRSELESAILKRFHVMDQ